MIRDRGLQPLISLTVLVALILSSSLPLASAAQPPIDPTTVYVGTIAMDRLRSDPKRAYLEASCGALMNVYDTLITTAAENHASFLPSLAAAWDKDESGLVGGTVARPVWWFKLRFTNDTGAPILFQPWMDRDGVMHTGDVLTMDDVIWSFYYGLVEDLSGSPMWMFWWPLFDSFNMAGPTGGLDPALAQGFVTELTTNRVWQNGTHLFFRLAFQFPDTAWLQIMSQTFASIISKDWAVDRGCWDGTWFKTEIGESVGTGDGFRTRFTLPQQDMPLGGPDAYKKVVPGTEFIYLDGVPTMEYTMIYGNGTIDFTTPPGAGVAVTADYEHAYFYYFRRWPEVLYGPLDSKLPDYPQSQFDNYLMCGTGPYKFSGVDTVNKFFRHDKFDNYWRGWALTPSQPAHVNTVITSWADGLVEQWTTRLSKFLAGDYDIIGVRRVRMFDLFKPGYDINNPNTWLPLDGVYGVKNIAPVVALDAIHFTFALNPLTTYAGTQSFPDGIPLDFFSNIHVRRAFAYMFNYTQFIHDMYYGEAEQPTTWSIRGLSPDYTLTNLTKWSKDLDKAKAELQSAIFTQGSVTKSAWDWGFKLTIPYPTTSSLSPSNYWVFILEDALAELSSMYGVAGHFGADLAGIGWGTYIDYFMEAVMPLWTIGWLQDYSDPDNLVRPYMHSEGDFAYFQHYNNAYVDQLINWGLHNSTYMPDGTPNPLRRLCYEKLQMIYMEDVPSFPIIQPLVRHFCRTWVRGWYYNAFRPAFWYYHLWKQDGAIDTVTDQVNTVCDLNWDDIVDMKDIGIAVKAFGSTPGTPKWNFNADVAQSQGDRKIDMKDIGYVVSKFGWAA